MPQRPSTVRVSSATFSDWIPLNRYVSAFGVGFGVKLEDGSTLTYTVQHTFDDIYERVQNFSIARVTTTATVTQPNHGLSVGDWVYFTGCGAPFDGAFAVATVADTSTFTFTVPDSGAAASAATGWMQRARVFAHADVAAETASADGNYQFPPVACRLNVSAYTDGFADLTVISAGK